jgi:hypothetical protein
MRIATWNLERGGRNGARSDRQRAVLETLAADVLILTEPHSPEVLPGVPTVGSPTEREGNGVREPWVAIVGATVEPVEQRLDFAFEDLAVSALAELDGKPALVVGSVLPWRSAPRHAPNLARPGETYAAMFERILRTQRDGMLRLRDHHPDHLLIWAGDFNQSLIGPNLTGSSRGRDLLSQTLADLELVAWNATASHATPPSYVVDLICGPAPEHELSIETIPTHWHGDTLSDHLGYVVTA